MNFEDILPAIQDFRSQLETWGVTTEGLWCAAVGAAVLFLISVREVSSWYFKVNRVRDEIRALRAQLVQLQSAVNEMRLIMTGGSPSTAPLKPEELVKIAEGMRDSGSGGAPSDAPAKFRFDH